MVSEFVDDPAHLVLVMGMIDLHDKLVDADGTGHQGRMITQVHDHVLLRKVLCYPSKRIDVFNAANTPMALVWQIVDDLAIQIFIIQTELIKSLLAYLQLEIFPLGR